MLKRTMLKRLFSAQRRQAPRDTTILDDPRSGAPAPMPRMRWYS